MDVINISGSGNNVRDDRRGLETIPDWETTFLPNVEFPVTILASDFNSVMGSEFVARYHKFCSRFQRTLVTPYVQTVLDIKKNMLRLLS